MNSLNSLENKVMKQSTLAIEKKTKAMGLFLLLSYAISWSLYFSFGLSEGTFTGYLMKFGFSISGVLIMLFTKDLESFKRIRFYLTNLRTLNYFWIGLLPLVAYFLSAFLSVPAESLSIQKGVSLQKWMYTFGFSSSSGMFFYLFFRGGLGEEIGLRGYFLTMLLKRLNPLKASLVLGIFWALWHYPLWISKGILTVAVLTIAVMAWSSIFTYVLIKTRSLWVVMLLHATSNCGDDLMEFIFPGIINYNWEIYYILIVIIIGIVLSISLKTLEFKSFNAS